MTNDKFAFPTIIQFDIADKVNYFKEESVVEVWPRFIGQFRFSDSIYFTGEPERRDSTSENQYLWEQKVFKFDTLSSDGLQVLANYETSIIYKDKYVDTIAHYYYPVYIVNETTAPKIFIGKDSYVFAIQEALDTSAGFRWYPIEGRGFDFCGNGYFRRKILPKEFIMFLFPKYSGLEETMVRVRLKIGDDLIISRPFKGKINRNQLNIKKDSWFYNNLKETKGSSANWIFYGAFPKDIDKF